MALVAACTRPATTAQQTQADEAALTASPNAPPAAPAAAAVLYAPGPTQSLHLEQDGRAPLANQRLFADGGSGSFAVYGVSGWTAVEAYVGPSLAALSAWHPLYDNKTGDWASSCAFEQADHVQLERPQVVFNTQAAAQEAPYLSFVKAVPIGAAYGTNPYLYAKLAVLRAPSLIGPWTLVRCTSPTWDGGPGGAGVTLRSGQSTGSFLGPGALYVGDLAADIDPADGQGFLLFSAGYLPFQGTWSGSGGLQVNWLHLVALTGDGTMLGPSVKESVVSGREAPVLFRVDGAYAVASSATVGWGGSNTVVGRGTTYAEALADHDRQFPAGPFDPASVGMNTFGGQVSGAFDLAQSGRPLLLFDIWAGAPTYASDPRWAAAPPAPDGALGSLYPGAFYVDTEVSGGVWGPLGTGAGWGPQPSRSD